MSHALHCLFVLLNLLGGRVSCRDADFVLRFDDRHVRRNRDSCMEGHIGAVEVSILVRVKPWLLCCGDSVCATHGCQRHRMEHGMSEFQEYVRDPPPTSGDKAAVPDRLWRVLRAVTGKSDSTHLLDGQRCLVVSVELFKEWGFTNVDRLPMRPSTGNFQDTDRPAIAAAMCSVAGIPVEQLTGDLCPEGRVAFKWKIPCVPPPAVWIPNDGEGTLAKFRLLWNWGAAS